MNTKPTTVMMAACLPALMQNAEMNRWVRDVCTQRGKMAGGSEPKDIWARLAYDYAEALNVEVLNREAGTS
jgi:hypothetical protein